MEQLLVLVTCCVLAAWVRMTSAMQNDVDLQDAFFAADADFKRSDQEDMSKLLLKHLRFRDLPESDAFSDSDSYPEQQRPSAAKRPAQRALVSNLAALLSGMRERNIDPMRMPSLRFGK